MDDASDDPDLAAPNLVDSWEINDALTLKTYNYFDLAGTYRLSDGLELAVGINNLFDRDPPLSPSLSSSGWSGTYDPLGRTVFSSLRFTY